MTIYERPLGAIVPHLVAGDGACCAAVFLPSSHTLQVEKVADEGDGLRIRAHTRTSQVLCPQCTAICDRVHARYERRLHDGVLGGRPVVIHLVVRRFICANNDCDVATFTEQVPGLTLPYRRRTVALLGMLEQIAVALAGRAGARLAGLLGIVVHPTTLIRLLRALPDPERRDAPKSSALMTSRYAAATATAPSSWTWPPARPSTCWTRVMPNRSPAG